MVQMKKNKIDDTVVIPFSSTNTENLLTEKRPWGSFTTLEEGPGYKIKRIEVNPGHRLSLQMHYHRSEHWIVVSGTAKVTCGDKEKILGANESTYVPQCTSHRLENPGVIKLILILFQIFCCHQYEYKATQKDNLAYHI